MKKRTLALTHEQIYNLCQALGIAETKMTGIHKEIIETTVNVRGRISTNKPRSQAGYYHDMANIFADLNVGIYNGDFDV